MYAFFIHYIAQTVEHVPMRNRGSELIYPLYELKLYDNYILHKVCVSRYHSYGITINFNLGIDTLQIVA